jgi:replication factor C small subunit
LNASDARGIEVIRTQVKDFAKTKPPEGIPFKILILDEADNMTADAQQALRRTMENFTNNCRFILICNYSNKLILPIQSRCAVFRFSPLTDEEIRGRINHIVEIEKAKLTPEGLDALVYVCGGDLRRAVNYLQSCATLDEEITQEMVYKITGKIHPSEIQEMIMTALNRELGTSMTKLDSFMQEYGLSGRNIVSQMHQEIYNLNISERKKLEIIKILAEIEYRLSQGGTEEVQLNAMLAKISMLNF